jgi:hypothetical protein
MPFIIGELGMQGIEESEGRDSDRVLAMRKAERGVTLQDEFRYSTLFVPTAQYAVNIPTMADTTAMAVPIRIAILGMLLERLCCN